MALRGVNLGNWLVLERWMGGSPLNHARVADDYAYVREVPANVRARDLAEHWRTYVTQQTFSWLANTGVTLLRVPVPYHLFGSAHHVACVQHLDDAFAWAERYGLRILVDLHTVPLSQNGFDNGGYTALCAWSRSKRRMAYTVDVLERIARRYAGRQALWGIELLNEPASKRIYVQNMGTNMRYPARILRSWPISRRRLSRFYAQAYERVRPVVGPEVKIVLHDQFDLRGWERLDLGTQGSADNNVWLDTHQYVGFCDKGLRRRDLAQYRELIARMGERVRRAAQVRPVLVGEWCLANHAKSPSAGWYQEFAAAQLDVWDEVGGSCFWSLRVQRPGFENWSFEHCVRNGWLDA